MISDLLARLLGNDPAPLPEPDIRLALGALMVRVAKADRTYLAEEIGEIDRLLARRFDLNPVEAAKMRATCELLEKEAPDDARFTNVISQKIDEETREKFYGALFQVMIADGVERPEERDVLRRARAALGLSPEAAQGLRQDLRKDA